MTAEQQKQMAIQFLKQFEHPDAGNLAAMIADDFEYELMARVPGTQTRFSRQEMLQTLVGTLKAMAPNGFNFKFGTAISEGPHVALQLESDTVAGNGRKYANRYHFYFRFEGDKVARVREYCDTNHVREVFMA